MSGEPETVSPTLLLAIELWGAKACYEPDSAAEVFFNLEEDQRGRWENVARLVEAKIIRAVEQDRAAAPLSIERSEHERLLREAIRKATDSERVEELERAIVNLVVMLGVLPETRRVPHKGRVT